MPSSGVLRKVTPEEIVGVEVPASSANLGPGFDALAVAVDLKLTVWTNRRSDLRVINEGEGADELPGHDGNLIWRALRSYCDWAGVGVPDVSLRTCNEIPLERGLGSSAAAAVAGVALGRALTSGGGRDEDLVDLAAALEGHPDNAAAAMLGGLTVCFGGQVRRLDPTDLLRPVVCVPPARQSTEAARGLLPEAVPLAEAAANAARAAVVLAGLSGAMAWEPGAMLDVLHEPPRLAHMQESGLLVARVRAVGLGACLSGAGPTVLVIAPDDEQALTAIRDAAPPGWQVWPRRWQRSGAALCPPSAAVAPR